MRALRSLINGGSEFWSALSLGFLSEQTTDTEEWLNLNEKPRGWFGNWTDVVPFSGNGETAMHLSNLEDQGKVHLAFSLKSETHIK